MIWGREDIRRFTAQERGWGSLEQPYKKKGENDYKGSKAADY